MRILVMIMSLIFTFSVMAAKVKAPDHIEGVQTVNAQETKTMMDQGVVVVDVRKKLEFNENHIPGAKYIGYKDRGEKVVDFDASKDKFDLKELEAAIGGKTKKAILYCNGEFCWQSYKAIIMARKAGFTNLMWFRGGVPEWQKAGFKLKH